MAEFFGETKEESSARVEVKDMDPEAFRSMLHFVYTDATTLALADQRGCSLLKAKCLEFIVSTPEILDVVMATEGYKQLETSCPSVLRELLKSARERMCS
ncbi:unnamed protein product [Triticum turgidum subsp. durum]|uniref:BPM/SPOP BACK domain-containing protein n=1 Tax=Triticum turgidum subsp. durum TaxID=4567 RepID=A0A9R1C356_TRITD|nr:unnamed protein product [Triticum turgidum subsp. durum]